MPNFWLYAFTAASWEESQSYDFRVAGFHLHRSPTVQRMQQGDVLICWVTGLQKIVGALRVTGAPYLANEPHIWAEGIYPARVPVEPMLTLRVDDGCDLRAVMTALSFYNERHMALTWGHFQKSPNALTEPDGALILAALGECNMAALEKRY